MCSVFTAFQEVRWEQKGERFQAKAAQPKAEKEKWRIQLCTTSLSDCSQPPKTTWGQSRKYLKRHKSTQPDSVLQPFLKLKFVCLLRKYVISAIWMALSGRNQRSWGYRPQNFSFNTPNLLYVSPPFIPPNICDEACPKAVQFRTTWGHKWHFMIH